MKTTENYLAELKAIRKMMEDSSRFLSLSGLSGILIGIYAILGAFIAYRLLHAKTSLEEFFGGDRVTMLIVVAAIVLIVSLITIVILTVRRANKAGKKIWNPGSRLMLLHLTIPLLSGGILILAFVHRGVYEIVSPACLVFYGLALVNAAKFTRQEIFQLGLIQVSLGVLAALIPPFGLLFWAMGFGLVHIIYGALMYFRYEHDKNA